MAMRSVPAAIALPTETASKAPTASAVKPENLSFFMAIPLCKKCKLKPRFPISHFHAKLSRKYIFTQCRKKSMEIKRLNKKALRQ
jgi:hypothetical protein